MLYYYNERLQVGMADIRRVYLLSPHLTLLHPEVYKGKLAFRAKDSSRRISYDQIKKGLIKKKLAIVERVPDWLR